MDWQAVRLDRTSDGVYIWGAPSDTGADRMWGLPVVQSDNDSAGTGYVGSFQPAWITLAERAGVQVEVGFVGALLSGLQSRQEIFIVVALDHVRSRTSDDLPDLERIRSL